MITNKQYQVTGFHNKRVSIPGGPVAVRNIKKLQIHLHVAIPTSKENMDFPITAQRKIKRVIRKAFDWTAWAVSKKFLFKGYNYASRIYCNRGDIAIKLAIKELLQARFHDFQLEFVESEWGQLSDDAIERINSCASLFVIAGGGYWVFNKEKKLSPSFLSDVDYFQKITCPLVVFGSGVNFNNPSEQFDFDINNSLRDAFTKLDDRVDLLAVRCELTFNFLRSLGLKKPRLLCDPAVFLKANDSPYRTTSEHISIGVNLAFHGPFVEAILKKNLHIYVALLQSIQNKFKVKFYYLIHSDEEFLIVKLLKFSGIKIDVIDEHGGDLVDAYGNLDVVLCQMMHSNILSFNAGVPTLNIAYDSKNFGFNKLIGMENFCVSVYDLSEEILFEKMTDIITNRDAIKLKLAAKKKKLALSMDLFLSDVRNMTISYRKLCLTENAQNEIVV
ncbi:polysaccharide pyruvyl transferase family protein [Glaciimonas sp. Gout2]|uniref:polysaccharide pyruvyl transferase family protein n=1 Tax=unclassified Glaciimonas TaxID=2644401 RepID=UPI002B236A07|nr:MULTISPECIES: polysaccharide pyruvyl transferase family protein [unclassified Glaciimonas]MEB0012025.1 polysaccharide pyruvyl transferase family protein [Glaciimonas sp. Cout2]MEB0084059.1 polysaccharide pyruvyl transferase family protein [Glaciimonas sp. Gout2]